MAEEKSYLTQKVTWKTVGKCINRMFERDKRRRARNVYPDEPCAQCGSEAWESETDGIWRCFICGHRGFWENNVFTQIKQAG